MSSPMQQPSHATLEALLAHLQGVRQALRGWTARCPAHHDQQPSLSIDVGEQGQILLKCFAGCPLEAIVEAVGMTVADLFPRAPASPPEQTQHKHLTLLDLAQEKMLHWKYLFQLGVSEERAGVLRIPYHLPDGTPAPRHRLRTALAAREGSRWSKGKGQIVPYGLERLEAARKAGLSSLWRVSPIAGRFGCTGLRLSACPEPRWSARCKKAMWPESTPCTSCASRMPAEPALSNTWSSDCKPGNGKGKSW